MVFVKSSDDLRFVRFNKAGEELLGHAREDLIGKNDYDFFPPDEADFFSQKDREVLEERKLVDIPEEPIETKTGTRILHTKKLPILDEEGVPRFLLGISEDITERKEAEQQLREAKEEAERANRAKDEFLSRMSHELRTPLNAVLGFAQVLQMGSLDTDESESVKQILRGGRHLLALIDEVLDISRISTGQLSISQEPVSVAAAIKEAVELVRPIAAERGIEFREEAVNGSHVLADRQRLKQVLLNLLSNGVKYNRPGGIVSISWEEVLGGRSVSRWRIPARGSQPRRWRGSSCLSIGWALRRAACRAPVSVLRSARGSRRLWVERSGPRASSVPDPFSALNCSLRRRPFNATRQGSS